MSGFDEVDFFTDAALVVDPYPYYEALRSACPVQREPYHGTLAVTGYDEAAAIYHDPAVFSSCNSVIGPLATLPFQPEGDDLAPLIERHRDGFPMYEHLVTFDPPRHTAHRELLRSVLTPERLRDAEEPIRRIADRQIDEFHAKGRVEIMADYARPFALLVIADLLGVPEEEHQDFRERLCAGRPGPIDGEFTGNPLDFLERTFTAHIQDRRDSPREDVLTSLATATFPDGTLPEVIDVARIACLLFAAAQDTTARLLTSVLYVLAERPELQERIREDRDLIPVFVEETLRMESPIKSDFRLAAKSTTVGGVTIPAGSTVMVLPGAVNRDPGRFDSPAEFRLDRPNTGEHMAFGRGAHSCPGAPLARVEASVSLQRLLDRLGDIEISERGHGPLGARRFTYEPTYILRGLSALHLEYTPLG